MAAPRPIATLNEGPLHAGIKAWYARPGDRIEAPVDGRQVDIVRGPLLIEIQTGGFGSLKKKLAALLADHPVRLVYPVAYEKWIVRVSDQGRVLGRRKSPKRGRLEEVFAELVSLPRLLARSNFTLEVLLTREDELRPEGARARRRRRGRALGERRLIDVVERRVLHDSEDLRRLLPLSLPSPFTTADLAGGLRVKRDLAQKMAYCLRESGVILAAGRRGRSRLYRRDD